MTKEEWKIVLKEAQDNLNSLVDTAREEGVQVNLTVIGKGPTSLISNVSVEVVDN
jgi:hypothetical protein